MQVITYRNGATADYLQAHAAVLSQCTTKTSTFNPIKVAARWPWFVIAKHGIPDTKGFALQYLGFDTRNNQVTTMTTRVQLVLDFLRLPFFRLAQIVFADHRHLAGIGGMPETFASAITVALQAALRNRIDALYGLHFVTGRAGDKDRLECGWGLGFE
jgi:hypothetical protein